MSGLLTDCEEKLKQEYYQSRQATASLVGQVSRRAAQHMDVLTHIEQIIDQATLDDHQKVEQIRATLSRKKPAELLADQQRVGELQRINQPIQERSDYYRPGGPAASGKSFVPLTAASAVRSACRPLCKR